MRALILAAIAIVVLAGGACGGSGGQEPTPAATSALVPTATTTPATATPGLSTDPNGFRAFAAQIQQAAQSGDTAFFRDRAITQEVLCTPDNMQGLGGPVCDFEGQEYEGFSVGYWRSEGNTVPVDEAMSFAQDELADVLPTAEDDFGSGELRVYALAIDDGHASAVITALIERPPDFAGEGPLRVARVTSWTFENGEWRFASLLNAFVLAEEFLAPCQPGLDFLSGTWERYPDPSAPAVGESACPF